MLCPMMIWTVEVSKESLSVGDRVSNGGMGVILVVDLPSDSRRFANVLGRLHTC